MSAKTRDDLRARKERALELLAAGKSTAEAAAEAGLHVSTVRRLRSPKAEAKKPQRRPGKKAAAKRSAAEKTDRPKQTKRASVLEMLRAEAPEVYRVLLDAAKGGDIRAAGLVVKGLGSSLAEGTDDGDSDAAFDELERGLQSLPSDIASEVAGLLAEARARATGPGASEGAPSGRHGWRPGQLPEPPEDRAPDEGTDQV